MRAAFQGVHGAYSEVACFNLLGEACRTLPCPTFDGVFEAVASGRADRGVIPIENSLAGSIHQNYDLLLRHPLHIVGETHLRVEHVLMCHPKAGLRDLRTVRSHPQALAQCSRFFAENPGIHPEVFFDTAGAAESLLPRGGEKSPGPARLEAQSLLETGAIASVFAARLYGLKILRRNLEDFEHNFTRFLLIARKPARPPAGVPSKCSISFAPAHNQVGILFRILGVFALRDIDLLKIESRPDRSSAFEYRFHLDLAGTPAEEKVARALDHLQEVVREYRLLGAYPQGGKSFIDAEGPGGGKGPGRGGREAGPAAGRRKENSPEKAPGRKTPRKEA